MESIVVARNPLEEEASSEEEEFALRVLREGVTRNQEPGTRGTGLTGPLSPPLHVLGLHPVHSRLHIWCMDQLRNRLGVAFIILGYGTMLFHGKILEGGGGVGRFAFSIAATKLLCTPRR